MNGGGQDSWSRMAFAGFVAAAICVFVALCLPGAASAFEKTSDVSYDLGSPPQDPERNELDIYLPSGPGQGAGLRPVMVFIHGGGWRAGDKANSTIPDKARLITGLGYGFVSVNYRLSPMTGNPDSPDPGRIMFPDHPDDVGEAVGWLDRNAVAYGLDPDRIFLMGHSAGAHLASLVSTDPSYVRRYGVDPRQMTGTVTLDTGAFDVARAVGGGDSSEASLLFMNAFGTPAENAATDSWRLGEGASPL